MIRVAVLLLSASVAFAAPKPKGKGAEIYFPTKVGDTRVYEVRLGDQVQDLTDVVTSVEETDGGWLVATSYVKPDGRRLPFNRVMVSEKRLAMTFNGSTDLDPPMELLRLPAKPGDTWESKPAKPITPSVSKVKGEEQVEVPAGKFKAIRVDIHSIAKGVGTTDSIWYSPGLGKVRHVAKLAGKDYVVVLKSFTPGK